MAVIFISIFNLYRLSSCLWFDCWCIQGLTCLLYAGYCVFVDAEHALDQALAVSIGVNTKNLLLSQPDCGEQAFSLVDTLIRSGSVDVIVVDSVSTEFFFLFLFMLLCLCDSILLMLLQLLGTYILLFFVFLVARSLFQESLI